MPTYVYACDQCGAQFEQVQRFSDEPIKICPSCAGVVRRVFQPVGIVFKGSGWYIKDSKESRGGATAPATSSTGKESSSASESAAGESEAKAGESEAKAGESSAAGGESSGSSTPPEAKAA